MKISNLVYSISDKNGNVVYVGVSGRGDLGRAYSHGNSHNEALREWVNNLGYTPIVSILEMNVLNLYDLEMKWVYEFESQGHKLFNIQKQIKNAYELTDAGTKELGFLIKNKRRQVGLTQPQFAHKMGVGVRLIRKIEQGNLNIMLPKLIQILNAFGMTLTVKKKDNE